MSMNSTKNDLSSGEEPWHPMAVMFATYGSRITSKLLFKYPYGDSMDRYKQLTGSVYRLKKSPSGLFQRDNTMTSKDPCLRDLCGCDVDDDDDDLIDKGNCIRDEATQLTEFTDETLGHMLTPHNMSTCGRKFDVKINGLWFVGFPLMLEKSNLDCNRPYQMSFKTPVNLGSEKQDASKNDQINVLYFNVVFVLKTSANYSVVESFQQLSSKIGLGLRFEEKRDSYVTNQTRLILNLFEAEENEEANEHVYKKIVRHSSLARFLKEVLKSVQGSGVVELSLNNNLRISFCSYPKVHGLNANDKIALTEIERTLQDIQPYHGLFVYDIEDVYSSLTPFSSPSIHIFLQVYKPTKSLQSVATDADIPLDHIYAIVRHLVSWGKACIIYPLCETNIYMIAPTAVLDTQSPYVEEFSQEFDLNLQFVLSHFSTPVRLGDLYTPTGLFYDDQQKLIKIIFWMLRHRFLVQHHTYVLFLPPPSLGVTRGDLQRIKRDLVEITRQTRPRNPDIDMCDLPQHCQVLFRRIEAARNASDLTCFLKLLKYFDGKHHLEEMMYKENIQRLQLLTVLDKFHSLLMTCSREDEIASHYHSNLP